VYSPHILALILLLFSPGMTVSTWGRPPTVLASIPEELEVEPVESQYFTIRERDGDFDRVGKVREGLTIWLKKYHRMLLTNEGKEAMVRAAQTEIGIFNEK
jgi:hypothetical protein